MEKLEGLKWTVMVLHLLVSIITKAELLSATRPQTKRALWSKKDPTLTRSHTRLHTHAHIQHGQMHFTLSIIKEPIMTEMSHRFYPLSSGFVTFRSSVSLSPCFQLLVYQCHSPVFTGCFRHARINVSRGKKGKGMKIIYLDESIYMEENYDDDDVQIKPRCTKVYDNLWMNESWSQMHFAIHYHHEHETIVQLTIG